MPRETDRQHRTRALLRAYTALRKQTARQRIQAHRARVRRSPSVDIPDLPCNPLSSDSDSDSSSESSESSVSSSPSSEEEDEEDQLLDMDGLTLEDLPDLMKRGWDWADEDEEEDFLMGYSDDEDEDEGDDDMDMEEVGGEDTDSEDVLDRQPSLAKRVRNAVDAEYAQRYQQPRTRILRPPPSIEHVLTVYKTERPDHFRGALRVSPRTFDRLLEIIQGDPIFAGKGGHEQLPVDLQLAIALYRFGRYGNGVRAEDVAQWGGVGKGTVLLITRRVLRALTRRTVLTEAIRWPTDEEIEEAKQWVETTSRCRAWRDGWCFVDGTLVPLAFRPHWFGESYFDRKCNYSMNFQVCSLHHYRSTSS
jgi:hypothetical protein